MAASVPRQGRSVKGFPQPFHDRERKNPLHAPGHRGDDPPVDAHFSIIDFETTTSPNGLRAVEVAVLAVGPTGIEQREVHLVRPGCQIDWHSRMIHGIGDPMVRYAPSFPEVFPRIAPLLSGRTVFAHYAPFDRGVLEAELARHRLPHPRPVWRCSCRLARRVWPHFERHKLGYLQERLGLRGSNAHRAEADAELTYELIVCALEELRRQNHGATDTQLLAQFGRGTGAG